MEVYWFWEPDYKNKRDDSRDEDYTKNDSSQRDIDMSEVVF